MNGARGRLPFDFQTEAIRRRVVDVGTLFLLCALVGVVAGLGAAGFHVLLNYSRHLFLDGMAGYRPEGPAGEAHLFAPTVHPLSRWALFVLPAAGGLVSGILVYWLAPEAEGHGTDAAIDAYHHKQGAIRARVPFVKTLASAITIGTGGSAGREGPIAQIGAGLGSNLAKWLGLPAQQRRVLMAAGLGAGIGSIFRAPLAGALFAGEVLYSGTDIEFEVITPAILASIVGYSTFGLMYGWQPLFATPSFAFTNPAELGPYLALAVVVALGGRAYAQIFYAVRDRFRALPVPPWIKPAIGGLCVGAIGLFRPEALATSFGVVQKAFFGETAAGLLFAIALAKLFATAFTVGSGGSGGVFGPAVVIGGALGGAVGQLFHAWVPHLVPQPGAFAMVGMAGFFAAAAHVPLSTVIMVSELTGNYALLVPSMFVCMTATLIVRRQTIYEQQIPGRGDSPAHRRQTVRTMLERLRVEDILALRPASEPPTLGEATPLAQVLKSFATSGAECLPVVDQAGQLVGQIHRTAVQQMLGAEAAPPGLVLAKDIATPPLTIGRTQSVFEALRTMAEHHVQQLLVVSGGETPRAEAVLTAGDVNAIFDDVLGQANEEQQSLLSNVLGRWREAQERQQRTPVPPPVATAGSTQNTSHL
jgi:CIC family chloride channel protein